MAPTGPFATREEKLAMAGSESGGYVERCRRAHPDRPPLDRRAFYRARQDEVESQPQQRCC